MTDERETQRRLDDIYERERKAWLGGGAQAPEGFDEALRAAKAAAEKAYRDAVKRAQPTDMAEDAWRLAFKAAYTAARRPPES